MGSPSQTPFSCWESSQCIFVFFLLSTGHTHNFPLQLKCRERGRGDKTVWNSRLIPFSGYCFKPVCILRALWFWGTETSAYHSFQARPELRGKCWASWDLRNAWTLLAVPTSSTSVTRTRARRDLWHSSTWSIFMLSFKSCCRSILWEAGQQSLCTGYC